MSQSLTHRGAAAPSPIHLRPYQEDALAAIEAAERRGIRRQLVAQATGTGKTIVFASLLRRRGGRGLVLAHRDELIEQACDKLRLVAPSADLGVVKGGRDEHGAAVVVASVQTLSRGTRLRRLPPEFSTVIVDEAHHATAETYSRILTQVGSFRESGGPLTVGFTATPERADGTPLTSVFDEVVYRAGLLDMITAGYLVDLRAIQVHLECDLDTVRTIAGDLASGEVDEVLRAADAPRHVVAAYEKHARERKAIIFTPTVASARDMAAAFVDSGIAAETLDGSTPALDRRAILARLRSGETRVVANCAVLTEGFDEPSIDAVIIARPTKSRPLYEQMIGRGTRLHPAKKDCLILDVVGNTSRHSLVTTPALFHLSPAELSEASVGVATAAKREQKVREEAHGRLVAQAVDLFQRRPLNWVASDATQYALSTGDGSLLVLRSEDLKAWRVERITREKSCVVLATGLDLGFAQGTAEDYARRLGAGALIDRSAAWRRAPATDEQIRALHRWRVAVPSRITKGEASDLLTAAAARCA